MEYSEECHEFMSSALQKQNLPDVQFSIRPLLRRSKLHPPTPSPRLGEGEQEWLKVPLRSGRGLKAFGIHEKGEGV